LEDNTGKRLQIDTLRIGQEWLWNPARKVGDNRLKQSEEFVWEVSLPLSQERDGVKLVVLVYMARLTSANARHMMATEGVNENYLENGQHLVKNMIDYYPFAMVVFKEEIELKTRKRHRYSPEELIALSKAEKGKPLEERDY
jgi:hypothetical protein